MEPATTVVTPKPVMWPVRQLVGLTANRTHFYQTPARVHIFLITGVITVTVPKK